MRRRLALTLALAGCGRFGFDTASSVASDVGMDSDAPPPPCTTPFTAPQKVVELASAFDEFAPELSEDGLELYWHGTEPTGTGGDDLWIATRATTAETFGVRAQIANANSVADDGGVTVSRDGLELYFSSERGGSGGDIYVARRASRAVAFPAPAIVVELSSAGTETSPALSPDGLEIYFTSDRAGGEGLRDLWLATRATTASPFRAAQNLSEINSGLNESSPMVTADGLTLVYEHALTGQPSDVYIATRPTRDVLFSPGVTVDAITLPNSNDITPSISPSGERIAFSSNRFGSYDVFVATRVCP